MTFQNIRQGYTVATGTSPIGWPVLAQRSPNANDVNYTIGQFWLDETGPQIFFLASQSSQVTVTNPNGFLQSDWEPISSTLITMSDTGNANIVHPSSGLATPPNNIQLIGGTGITIVGDDATSSFTFSVTSAVPLTFTTNSGVATPAADNLNILGAVVAAGTNPLRTTGAGSTVTINAQISQAIAATDATKIGLSNFNSAQFTVDANGFVSMSGAVVPPIFGLIPDAFTPPGTSPVVSSGGNITFHGSSVAAGTNPVRTNSLAANTITLQVQTSQAIAATDATKIGLAAFNSANFSVDANGFVTLAATIPLTFTANSGSATPALNNLNILGTTAAAGTSPLVTSGAGSNITITAQRSQALASADSTKVGLSNFSSADFAVDANGFVTLLTTGAGKTITGDSGGALSPTANNWNILGSSGCKTRGSGSTLTIDGPPFSQVGGTGTSVLNSGEFVTATATRTLPATSGLIDGDLVIYYATTSNVLTVTANTGQTIRVSGSVSASAGTAASTAIGDSLTLRFDATAVSWRAVSVVGNWIIT